MNEASQGINSRGAPEISSQRFFGIEPFVDADLAAEFLSVRRKTILDWARAGSIPAHAMGAEIKLCGGSGSPKSLATGNRLIAQWHQAVPRWPESRRSNGYKSGRRLVQNQTANQR
jgi:hypothetical protein